MSIISNESILAKFILVSLLSFSVQAEENQWPMGCEVQTLTSDCVKIVRNKRQKQQLLLIHNFSLEEVSLFRDEMDPLTPIDTWKLLPNQIGTIILGKNSLEFCCLEKREGSEQPLPCQEVITLCILPHEFDKSISTEWLGASSSLKLLSQQLKALNIYLLINDKKSLENSQDNHL